MTTTNRSALFPFIAALLVVAVLYLGRELLIPLALASLFTFLLNPLVRVLLRWGLPRVAGVFAATLVCFFILALVAWLLGGELAHLVEDIPNYQQNILKRIESLQHLGEGHVLQRLRQLAGEVKETTHGGTASTLASQSATPATQSEIRLTTIL